MTNKYKVLAILVLMCGSYAIGRATSPVKTVNQEKIIYKESEQKHIVTVVKPDGSSVTTDTSTVVSATQASLSQITDQTRDKVTIQALIAHQHYGVSVSRKLIGPLTIGVFGFEDLRVGVSIGIEL